MLHQVNYELWQHAIFFAVLLTLPFSLKYLNMYFLYYKINNKTFFIIKLIIMLIIKQPDREKRMSFSESIKEFLTIWKTLIT